MISLVDLVVQYESIRPEINEAIHQVLMNGKFILGPNVTAFEQEVATYLGVKHAIGVASGTDSLVIALHALGIGPGDEVIVPAYSFFATAGCVLSVGAKPVIVDVEPLTYNIDIHQIEAKITPATKAILPVHLYGHPAEMDGVCSLAKSHGLKIVEDNAQAFGANYHGHKTASIGDIGCLSFFPTKNLGGYGDGGMVVTNDDGLAERMRMLRVHGWKKKYFPEMLGYNSRLDELQAAILRVKLRYVDRWNQRRRELAAMYTHLLASQGITVPVEQPGCEHVYHLYVLRAAQREVVQSRLKEAGIASDVYYPQPLHLTAPCRKLGYTEGDYPVAEQASRETLAIPLYPEMTNEQVETVVDALVRAVA